MPHTIPAPANSDDFDLEEKQGNVSELMDLSEKITDALRNAESCETVSDYRANMEEANDLLEQLQKLMAEQA